MKIEKSRARWDVTNDSAIAQAIRHARIPLCISDPNSPDNPVVFANDAFFDLTGYRSDEIIGKNCRLLQGEETTPESVDAIRQAIARQQVETVELVNYRKDGTKFINALQIGPILDHDGKLAFFFGSQLDVTEKRDAELRARKLAEEELIHRLRNIVNIMTVIIRMSANEESDVVAFSSLVSERLRALGDAHFQTINLPESQNLEFKALADTILAAYSPLGEQHFTLSGPKLVVPTRLISAIALGLHELATNSVKHGAFSAVDGMINLDWEIRTGTGGEIIAFRWEEKNGPVVVRPERQSGSKIISDLISAVGGTITLHWEEAGLIVEAQFPL